MPNLDEVVGQLSSSSPPALSSWPTARLAQYWDFLVVFLLILASLPLAWVSPHTVVPVPRPGTFDDHWVLDAAFKEAHGIFFGRDVAFLYGPLAHWLMAAPPRWAGLSIASIYTSYRTLLLWCSVLFSYLALRLLIPEQRPWKRFLLLLLLGVFWTSWDGRTALGILLFALFLRGWYAVREKRLKPVAFGCGAALLTTLAFWYSADTGIYGLAAWLIALGGVAGEGHRESRKFGFYTVAVAGFAISFFLLVFVTNAIIASPLDFHFWRSSLALVSVHRWNEPAPMSDAGAIHLLVPFVIGTTLFLLRLAIPAGRATVITARPGFLLSAFTFAVLSMQSGLVRSDPNHIVFGVFPMVFFAGTVLFSFASRTGSAVAALAAIGCSVLFSQPAPIFRPASIRYRLARMLHPITTCPSGFRNFERACYPAEFAETLEATVGYLRQHSGDHDFVVIFPYQYMFGVAARRNVAGGVEQSFLANGAYLSQLDIAGMERAGAPAGLYFPDTDPVELAGPILSLRIDDVSNFTRTPDVWLWIFRHYRLQQEVAPEIFGLERDDSRKTRISMQEEPLTVTARSYPIKRRSTAIDLGAPEWPVGGADFLRLRLMVRYSPLWKLRKPERLQLEITRADGSHTVRSFVVEPNEASEIWFYPWNEGELAHFFDSDESYWRVAPRPAVVNLRLLVTPLDWFSEKPESILIESADALRFSMGR